MDAIRELVLNALVHRDYSIHTDTMPIQLIMYSDRIEISNPGGLYGRIKADQLGKTQPDTRNPMLITAMEALGQTENRYSGIPRVRQAMAEMGLPEPKFSDSRSTFTVCLYSEAQHAYDSQRVFPSQEELSVIDKKGLLSFCQIARTRKEIVEYLGIPFKQYALKIYLTPLVEAGLIELSIPEKPQSHRQKYQTAQR